MTLRDAGVSLEGKHLWIVNNKMDLPDAVNPTPGVGIAVSSTQGTGLDNLRQVMVDAVRRDKAASSDILLTNARHYDALGRADAALRQVADALTQGVPADLVAVDLRDAIYHLGTITGDVANDEILSNIFSRFCIGK